MAKKAKSNSTEEPRGLHRLACEAARDTSAAPRDLSTEEISRRLAYMATLMTTCEGLRSRAMRAIVDANNDISEYDEMIRDLRADASMLERIMQARHS